MSLESDFAAWLDNGAPDALTRMFDATAGRLLLLAAHLAPGHTTAEDLVQATFLAALARGSTWNRRRPLWPWLTAILHNEARQEWRRNARRREVGIAEAERAATELPDPARLAASEEAFAAVIAAIDALPRSYRQVLRLRLVHGLRQIEIARALELPVGTVRARVHRGLAKLRESLPAGIASVAGVWIAVDGVALAQVRARVVAEATAVHATAPLATLWIGGSWTMAGKTLGLLVACAVVLLLLGFAAGLPPFERDHLTTVARPTSDAAVRTPTAEHRIGVDPPSRREVDDVPAPAWPLVVTVRDGSGHAIGGADVRVAFQPRNYGETRQSGIGTEIAEGRTEANGTFTCTLDEQRRRSPLARRSGGIVVSATHAGRSATSWFALPAGSEQEQFKIELRLSAAVGITGRVVDAGGSPVSDAEFYWVPSSSAEHRSRYRETSQEDGTFRIDVTDRERLRGALAVVHPSSGIGGARLPDEEANPMLDVGTIVLWPGATIRGRVVLGDGSPLAGFPLFVREFDGEHRDDPRAMRFSFLGSHRELAFRGRRGQPAQLVHVATRPVTNADGSFVCGGLDPDAVYAVGVRDTCMRYTSAVAKPGGEPIRLVVERQLLLLDVRDERGELLPGAGIEARGIVDLHPIVRARFYPCDAEGRRMLLSPFGFRWQLSSFEETAKPSTVHHEAFPGIYHAAKTLVLASETRFGSLRLQVTDQRGQPWQRFGFVLKRADGRAERNYRRNVMPASGIMHVKDLTLGRWRLTTYLGREALYPLEAHVRGMRVQDVVIAQSRTTDVRIQAEPAGLVGFRVRSETPPDGGVWKQIEIRETSSTGPVNFHVYDPERPHDRTETPRTGTLFVGKTAFAPGKHVFLITADGYRTGKCEVAVVSDRLVAAEVDLLAR